MTRPFLFDHKKKKKKHAVYFTSRDIHTPNGGIQGHAASHDLGAEGTVQGEGLGYYTAAPRGLLRAASGGRRQGLGTPAGCPPSVTGAGGCVHSVCSSGQPHPPTPASPRSLPLEATSTQHHRSKIDSTIVVLKQKPRHLKSGIRRIQVFG